MNKKIVLGAIGFFLLGFVVAYGMFAIDLLQKSLSDKYFPMEKCSEGGTVPPRVVVPGQTGWDNESPVGPGGHDLHPIGGDRDEHGCLIAGGYSWCETSGKCIRQWEEPCDAGGSPLPGEDCRVQTCHGLEVKCGVGGPGMCTAMYQAGDKCLQYAECETTQGQCRHKTNAKFDACKSCVLKCEKENPNSPAGAMNCESRC